MRCLARPCGAQPGGGREASSPRGSPRNQVQGPYVTDFAFSRFFGAAHEVAGDIEGAQSLELQDLFNYKAELAATA